MFTKYCVQFMMAACLCAFAVSPAFAGDCEECVGYSGWSTNDGGTAPDCDERVSTRSLGGCEASESGDCSESSKATTMTTSYLAAEDEGCAQSCDLWHVACIVGCLFSMDENCGNICNAMAVVCRSNCIECVILDGPTGGSYADGCV
jgi:hypothetical protein